MRPPRFVWKRNFLPAVLVTLALLLILSAVLEHYGFDPRPSKGPPRPHLEEVFKADDGSTGIRGEVESVIAGDSARLTSGRVVRYLGMDAPYPGQPHSWEARELNELLVLGKEIVLEVCEKRPTDRKGRTLARIRAEGRSVEERILERGLAVPYYDRQCDADRRERLFSLAKQALLAGKGLWSDGERGPVAAEKAGEHLGAFLPVECRVESIRRTQKVTLLLCGSDFKAVIFSGDRRNFKKEGIDPQTAYPGRRLRLWGKIKDYNGPEIVLSGPEQVEVLE